MKHHYDYAIIGAGPAGLAAAVRSHDDGLNVIVLDEQSLPGGQIYRAIERSDAQRSSILGNDYRRGKALADRFRHSGVTYTPATTIWHITAERQIYYLRDGQAGQLSADRILIATGAMERPVPILGWTLPGVMGAGSIDVLFKSSALMPAGRVVLAGTGPLLYLVACHLLDCEVDVAAILDTCRAKHHLHAIPHMAGALRAPEYLLKGLAMRLQILTRRVPFIQGISDLRGEGREHLERVSYRRGSSRRSIPADFLILHDGVVPNTQMTRLLECAHQWEPTQRYWHPVLDQWGNTSTPGIGVAGDSSGIYGAKSAALAGTLAAIETAHRLKRISKSARNTAAVPVRQKLIRERAIRPFLNTLFQPNPEFYRPPDDDTMVCRCEEITAGQIREAAAHGGMGPNQVKAKIRCGMGPCQGRMCGLTVAEIIAAERGQETASIGAFHIRPPLKPLPLEALANMELVQ